MKPCQNIIAIVENLRIHNIKEISSHIHAGKFVEEKEDHIVLIYVRSSAIKESVNLVSIKEP